MEDPACWTDEDCSDGLDNDVDGDVDCEDSDCEGATPCVESDCGDGVDNDGDALVDCWDPDCSELELCAEDCSDAVDNDLDGWLDCADSECAEASECQEDCSDGEDNDVDGETDCADADCSAAAHCIEDCADGLDNDLDGLLDCEDADCAGICTETSCVDGIDNDYDGYTDCEDEACWGIGSCPSSLALTLDGGFGTQARRWLGHKWSGAGSSSGSNWRLESVHGQARVTTLSGSQSCLWSASELHIFLGFRAYGSPSKGMNALGVSSTGACLGAITTADFRYSSWRAFPFSGQPLQVSSTTWVRYSTLWSSSSFVSHGTTHHGSKTRHIEVLPGGWWQKEGP